MGSGRVATALAGVLLLAALAAVAAMMVGCGGGWASPRLEHLEIRDVELRLRAIKWAGENKVEAAVPLLVDRLQEEDAAVRFFAIQALERITGTRMGYDYAAGAAQRAEAVARWRASLGLVGAREESAEGSGDAG